MARSVASVARVPSAARSSAWPPTMPAAPAARATSATASSARGAPRAPSGPPPRRRRARRSGAAACRRRAGCSASPARAGFAPAAGRRAAHCPRAGAARRGSEPARRRSRLLVLQWAADEPPGLGLEQDLDPLLHLGDPLGQEADEVDAALARGERLPERPPALLEAPHAPLELGQGLLEPGCLLGHQPSVSSTRARARLRAKTSATVSPARSAAASLTTGPAASPRRTMA